MFVRILLLLTVVPFVELVILLQIADRFSWEGALLLIVITGVVGAFLARKEGLKAIEHIRSDLRNGRVPTQSVVDGVLILVAGLVLMTPGLLTDLCGFALLIRPIRNTLRRRLTLWLKERVVVVHRNSEDVFVDVHAASRPASTQPSSLDKDKPTSLSGE